MNPADDREALVLFGLRETAASHDLRCVGRVLDQHDPLSAEAWGDCAHDFDCEADRTDASRSAALRAAGDACTALAGGDVAGAVAALAAGRGNTVEDWLFAVRFERDAAQEDL